MKFYIGSKNNFKDELRKYACTHYIVLFLVTKIVDI